MDESRGQAYLNLIQQLLICSNEEKFVLLQANSSLIDTNFIGVMEQVVNQMVEDKQQEAAEFLQNLLEELKRVFVKAADQLVIKSSYITNATVEKYKDFFFELLQVTLDSNGNPLVVYPILAANHDKLDDIFNLIWQDWATWRLSNAESELSQRKIANLIFKFSKLMQQFPLSRAEINIEVAITGYEIILPYTSEAFAQQRAMIQNNLATAYKDRIRESKSENLKMAIKCYEDALQVYTYEAFPYEWAGIQNNLATTYLYKIEKSREDNVERAIKYCQAALQIYTPEKYPQDWAKTQVNLAIAYCLRIRESRADNLKAAIFYYVAALEFLKREKFTQEWAKVQNNLALAYIEAGQHSGKENIEKAISCLKSVEESRIREEDTQLWATIQNNLGIAYLKAKNIQEAINCYKKALEVYTRNTFPEKWATIQNNLGNVYGEKKQVQTAENIEQAVACHQAALSVFSRNAYPYEWAGTLNNLALAYIELGQIESAVEHLQLALTIRTPETFPIDCLQTGRNLGDLAFVAQKWTVAIKGYKKAIEAVEQSREWTSTELARREIQEKAINVYFQMVQTCINVGNLPEAIEYAERSKARNLVELLATRDLKPKGDIPETILNELSRLRQEIYTEQRRQEIEERNRKILGAMMSESGFLNNRTHLNQLQQQLDELITRDIEPIDSNFSLTQKVKPIHYREIQSLTGENTTILEWYITGDKGLPKNK